MKQNFHIEKERAIFDIIAIAIDAAVDTHSRIGSLALIATSMLQADKSGFASGRSSKRKDLPGAFVKRCVPTIDISPQRTLQHFPVNLNRKDSQSVKDERVCRR